MAMTRYRKPNFLTRARAAVGVFRHGYPGPRRWDLPATKSAILGWPTLGDLNPQWHIVDYAAYVEEGFNLNALIYSAVMYKWRAVAAAPLRAWGGDRDHREALDPAHPLVKLTDRPNPDQGWRELQGQAEVYLNIHGNAYFWLMGRPKRGGLPEAVYCPRPDRVYVIPAREGKDGRPALAGYWYWPRGRAFAEGVPVLPQDMMHVKLPNPMDPLNGLGEGMSPVGPGAHSTDVDNNVTRFLKLFFERGGVPPFWFKFDAKLTDTDIAELRERVKELYGGYEGWTKHGVLDMGGSIERVGLTFSEMGFEVIDERNETRILGPVGVPGALIGSRLGLQRAIRANMKELRAMFWEDTMTPELGLFEQEFQYYLKTDDGAFVAFDLSGVPALQKDVPQLTEAAHKLWQMGVPANRAFEVTGLPITDVPGGDVGYVPLGMVPVGASPAKEPAGEGGAAEAEEDTRKAFAAGVPGKKADARR